eukprot:3068002-Prymnesium_polylepis.1
MWPRSAAVSSICIGNPAATARSSRASASGRAKHGSREDRAPCLDGNTRPPRRVRVSSERAPSHTLQHQSTWRAPRHSTRVGRERRQAQASCDRTRFPID